MVPNPYLPSQTSASSLSPNEDNAVISYRYTSPYTQTQVFPLEHEPVISRPRKHPENNEKARQRIMKFLFKTPSTLTVTTHIQNPKAGTLKRSDPPWGFWLKTVYRILEVACSQWIPWDLRIGIMCSGRRCRSTCAELRDYRTNGQAEDTDSCFFLPPLRWWN